MKLLHSLVQRSSNTALFRVPAERSDVLRALLSLRTLTDSRVDSELVNAIHVAFVRQCRVDSTRIADVVQQSAISVTTPTDGRAMMLLTYSIPKAEGVDEVLWEEVVKLAELGLREGQWPLHDLRFIISQIRHWGAYPPSLVEAVERYVASRVAHCNEKDLSLHCNMLISFQELHRSTVLSTIATRVVQLAEHLSTKALSSLCQSLHRAHYWSHAELAKAIQIQGIRFAEDCDLFGAVQMLCWLSSQQDPTWIDADLMKCLVERTVESDEGLDLASFHMLCRALRSFPTTVGPRDPATEKCTISLQSELAELVTFVSRECVALLSLSVKDGGVKDESDPYAVQDFAITFLRLIERRVSVRLEPSKEVSEAVERCCAFVTEHVEELVGSENPPFSLLPHLFGLPQQAAHDCAVELLREAALQNIALPTLQSFQFLLGVGDLKIRDKKIFRYLQRQFALSVQGIPMVQLCTALKCFARGLGVDLSTTGHKTSSSSSRASNDEDDVRSVVQKELDQEDLQTFLTQCAETIQKGFSDGMDIRSVLSLTHSMFALGYRDAGFYNQVTSYLSTKIGIASAPIHSINDAEATCLALGEDRLDEHPKLHEFLLAVEKEGTRDAHVAPSKWMNDNDPANHITPLTEEQHKSWSILDRMRETRSADTEALTKLAKEYLTLLPQLRPDDLRYFFGMFEEKVLKNDRVLKDCLDHLCELPGLLHRLSGDTIAAILHHLAAIRFSFYGSVKKFLLGVSEEQWSSLEAGVLVQVASGMSKLSLRLSGVLLQLSERLVSVCRFLTPMDTALLVNSLQSLGFYDDALFSLLMQHAAANARRFDEVSLTVLFGSSSIHRLMTVDTIKPLLDKACVSSISNNTKQKIVNSMKKSGLPRELIAMSSTRLAPELSGSSAPLRLEAGS